MTRILAPTAGLAHALATLINEEGGLATVLNLGRHHAVQALASPELVSNACRVLSFGDAAATAHYRHTHYARAYSEVHDV